MYPVLPGGVPAYTFALLLANLFGCALILELGKREGYQRSSLLWSLAALAGAAMTGAAVHSLLESGLDVESVGLRGLRYPGAVLGLLAALPIVSRYFIKAPVGAVADLFAPALPLGIFVARIGCFLNGCCGGTRCDLPWAISFPRYSVVWAEQVARQRLSSDAAWSFPVHPWQLYSAAVALGLFLLCLRHRRKRAFPGEVMLLYLILHNGIRAVLLVLRSQVPAGLTTASAAMALLALGSWAAIRITLRPHPVPFSR